MYKMATINSNRSYDARIQHENQTYGKDYTSVLKKNSIESTGSGDNMKTITTSAGFTRSYPSNIDTTISSSMMIFFNSVETIEGISQANSPNINYYAWTGSTVGDVPLKNTAWANRRYSEARNSLSAINNEINRQLQTYKRTNNAIHILSPDTIQYSSGAGWQDVDFNMSLIGLIANLNTTEATGKGTIQKELTQLGIDILGEGGNMADAATATVTNPYTQQAFVGMARRSFQFNWQLVPKNLDELQEIDEIISLLRFNMHPSISSLARTDETNSTGTNYLNFPGQIDIEWYFKDPDSKEWTENTWLPKITTCVIESIQTDYTPNGHYAFFNGIGAPTAINLSIQVKEIHPLQKHDIAKGR